MKHILYDMGFYFLWFMRTILEAILNSLNNVSRGEQRGWVGHNWENYRIGLFHVFLLKYFIALKWSLGYETHSVWYGILFFVIYEDKAELIK